MSGVSGLPFRSLEEIERKLKIISIGYFSCIELYAILCLYKPNSRIRKVFPIPAIRLLELYENIFQVATSIFCIRGIAVADMKTRIW
jgi:hypothetical protein